MTSGSFKKAWDRFFFTPISPLPLAWFRIFYGTCVTVTLLLLHSEWLDWFGVHAWVTRSTMARVEPGVRLDLFSVIPQDDRWIAAFFWIFLVFALMLTAGLWTRVSSVFVFLCLTSIQQRNLYILNGGDVFLRVTGFFLMFAPAGAALSLDRWIAIRRGRQGSEPKPILPWAQRMIQFELAFLYFTSAWWKLKGHTWVNGTALYYVFHLHALARFPLPDWIRAPVLLKIGGWMTILFEFCLGVFIWIPRFRYPILLLGVLFHFTLEYSLNTPIFQWDVLTAYVLFIDPADLERLWYSVRSHLTPALESLGSRH